MGMRTWYLGEVKWEPQAGLGLAEPLDRVGTGSMTSQAPPESALPCQVFPVELASMLASSYTRFEGPSSYTSKVPHGQTPGPRPPYGV